MMTTDQILTVRTWIRWVGGGVQHPDERRDLGRWVENMAARGRLCWVQCLATPQVGVEEERLLKEFQDAFQEALRKRSSPKREPANGPVSQKIYRIARENGCIPVWANGILGWRWHCGCEDALHAMDQQCSAISMQSSLRKRP